MTIRTERLSRLRKEMEKKKLDALLLTNSSNRKYITGFTGSAGYVLITNQSSVLLTDFRYTTQAAEQAPGFEIIDHAGRMPETIKELLGRAKISQLAFEQMDVTYGVYADLSSKLDPIQLVPSSGLVETIRMIKDEAELAIMKEAAVLADRTFLHVQSLLKPGVMEKEIALEIEIFMRTQGATSSSFDTIVASGERSALPHGVASDRRLGMGEFVTLDFGAYWKGYCSDLTRTVSIGTPPDKLKEIYSIVLEAQMHALDRLKPGMTGREADSLARDIIAKAGYGDRFGHSTGHGLGMEIHEEPRLSQTSNIVLEPGMTVTVEPGIYLPGVGGVRIEDDVVITATGAERLTFADKALLLLEP